MTFIGGKGETVIDYVLRDRTAWERIGRLEIGGEIYFDHSSLTVRLDGVMRRTKREMKKREKEETKWGIVEDWSEKAGTEFGERTEELEVEKNGIDDALKTRN